MYSFHNMYPLMKISHFLFLKTLTIVVMDHAEMEEFAGMV